MLMHMPTTLPLFVWQNFSLVAIILLIASGLFLFTYEATEFNTEGFLLVSLFERFLI